jgi:hypothetical protein
MAITLWFMFGLAGTNLIHLYNEKKGIYNSASLHWLSLFGPLTVMYFLIFCLKDL